MKLILSFSLLLIVCVSSSAQNGYNWQLPVPTGHDYSDLQLIGNNVAVAVGLEGTFIRSENGGLTWSYQYVQTQSFLRAVHFVNKDTGFVAGVNYCNYANLMKTKDGGNTWDSVPFPGNTNLNDIYFLNPDTGWIVGFSGAIYCTHDGGTNWIDQSVATPDNFNTITMLGSDTGFVAGTNGHMRKTTDGGTTWNTVATGTSEAIYFICFTSATTGFFAGFGELIKRTINGGQSWTQQYDYGSAVEMTSVFFTDSLHGFGVSPYRFYTSTDGGVTWDFTSGYTNVNDAAAIDQSGNGIMVGWHGNIQTTTDNGASWTSIAGNYNGFDLQSITFTDKTHGWAVGTGRKLLRTVNGVTWTQLSASPAGGADFDVCFLNNNTGYIVGDYGIVYKTTNGGTTLTNVSTPSTDALHCVHFVNELTGWVAGNNSTLYKTTNGGTSWTAQALPAFAYFLWDVFFVNANVGYVGGANHRLFKTVDGGNNWVLMDLPFLMSDVNHIQFSSVDSGWVSGVDGRMIRTTDGGVTWQNIVQLGIAPAYGFHFYDTMNGFAGGGTVNCDARFYRTNDGGVSWQNTHLPLAVDINGVYMTDTNSVYICGDYGNILHYGDSLTPVTTGMPELNEPASFSIFPNPAGSQFTITGRSMLSNVLITDIWGRVVSSKSCNASEIIYTTQFLKDGIYFVTINTQQGASQTKKLVVRKTD